MLSRMMTRTSHLRVCSSRGSIAVDLVPIVNRWAFLGVVILFSYYSWGEGTRGKALARYLGASRRFCYFQ